MSRPLVAVLGTWILVAFSGCPGADSVAPTAPPVEDVEGWPPVKGQPYHDMLLRDLSGESVRLASLKGTPLLIQFVATKCPGNVAYTAGDRAPPFEGLAPSPGCAGIDEVLASSGMDLDAASLLRVHVLVFETSTPVSLEQAQAWDAHFGLSARPNTLVFVADPAYATPTTLAYVPGYHLVDGDFTLVSDGTPGHDPLFEHTLPQAYRLVTGEDPQPGPRGIEDYAVPEGPLGLYAAGLGLLTGGAFEALESRLEARVPARRLAGSYEDLLHEELLALGQPYNVEALEAWAAARPQSFFAWIALGHARREQAWDARGGGVASTVTEEGWKDFKRYDVLAREAFETALELRQDLPYAHAWLIALGIDQGHEESMVLRHFRAAEAIDPQFVLAYELVLGYLSPRWHGSHERVQAFVQQALEEHPREPALRFLEYRMLRDTVRDLIAAGAAEDTSGVLAKHPQLLRDMEPPLRAVIQAYPNATQPLRGLAYVLRNQGRGKEWLDTLNRMRILRSAWATRRLGTYCASGWFGSQPQPNRARALTLEAARGGDPEAAHEVARGLEVSGAEVEEVARLARGWYRLALNLGHRGSRLPLARMLLEGRGGPADPEKARALLELAARGGDREARELLKQE